MDFFDPRYREPLILAANFDASAETIYQLYRDRWPVEQLPLAAKQMIGLLHSKLSFVQFLGWSAKIER